MLRETVQPGSPDPELTVATFQAAVDAVTTGVRNPGGGLDLALAPERADGRPVRRRAERLPVAADVLGLSTLLTGRRMEERGTDGERTLQFGVTYRGGPLAPEPGDGPARPGDRAPDAPGRTADGAPAPARGELVAVRPDGHVGARGSEADVTAFLRGVLPAVPAEV